MAHGKLPFEMLRISYMVTVFGNDFYSETMATIKSRTCILVSGTRATRPIGPVLASDSGSNKREALWELTTFTESWFLSPSHLLSCPDSSDTPLLFHRVLSISFLICWHPFWAIVVGEWKEGVVGFKAMSHFRVFGTLGG